MQVFGPGLWAWRFSSVIAATLAVIPTYLLARELFDRRVATISCAVMVSAAFFLTYARLGYNNAQALAPTTAAIYGLYAGLRRTSALYSVLAGVAAGIGFYTYTGARLGLLVGLLMLAGLLAWQLAQLLRQRGQPRLARLLACAGFFGAAWALVALPLLVYVQATSPDRASLKMVETLLSNVEYAGFYLPDENLFRDAPPLQVAGFTLFVRLDLYAYLLVRGLARSFLAFQQAKLLDSHFLVDPLAGSIGAIPYLLGLVVALRNIRQPRMLLILAWFVGGVVALSGIHTWAPRDAHLVPVIPAMSILVALGITASIDMILRRPAHAHAVGPGRANQLATLATTALLIGSGAWAYFVVMPRAYVPDLLTAAIRTSLDLQSGQTLVYVAHDDGDLRQSDWLRPSIAPGAELIQATAAEVAARPLVLAPERTYIVFFHAQDAARIRPGLAVATHLALSEQTLYDREGATIGVRAHLQPR
jgi:4-amino-4-deoxy-L-arabinose transferase-like glycosyltransferase